MKPTSSKSFLAMFMLVSSAWNITNAADMHSAKSSTALNTTEGGNKILLADEKGNIAGTKKLPSSDIMVCAILPKKAVETNTTSAAQTGNEKAKNESSTGDNASTLNPQNIHNEKHEQDPPLNLAANTTNNATVSGTNTTSVAQSSNGGVMNDLNISNNTSNAGNDVSLKKEIETKEQTNSNVQQSLHNTVTSVNPNENNQCQLPPSTSNAKSIAIINEEPKNNPVTAQNNSATPLKAPSITDHDPNRELETTGKTNLDSKTLQSSTNESAHKANSTLFGQEHDTPSNSTTNTTGTGGNSAPMTCPLNSSNTAPEVKNSSSNVNQSQGGNATTSSGNSSQNQTNSSTTAAAAVSETPGQIAKAINTLNTNSADGNTVNSHEDAKINK